MELFLVFFVQAAILSVCAVCKYKAVHKTNRGRINVITAFFTAAVLYVSILAMVKYIDVKLDRELEAFDLNGDGNFSEDERTAEQQRAEKAVIQDTARNFAPITGAVLSALYFPCAIGLLFLLDDIIGKIRTGAVKTSSHPTAGENTV